MGVYLIGEIGINHNGDVDLAKQLIDIAAVSGLDAVKFQKRNPDKCVPEAQKKAIKDTPWGQMSYLKYKYRLEFGHKEYDEINHYCQDKGIQWSASPWDIDSAVFLKEYKLPWVKIPSAMIVDEELLRYCSLKFPEVIFSTGMSSEDEISHAYEILKRGGCDITILHCNSSYPSPVEDLNLSYIKKLREKYPDCRIGYSGHEYGISTTVSTVLLGVKVIERHITLDSGMWGSDQKSSVEPHGIFKLVRGVRELEKSIGNGIKRITISEKKKRLSLRGY